MGMAPLDRSTLDRLQAAIAHGAPGWASSARLSTLGRWPARERFDVAVPGSLDDVIQAHRPGGARAKPTVGLAEWSFSEKEARLTGADRGASITFSWIESERSREPASITLLVVETTQREVDGIPAGEWVERLFRALCAELAPAGAKACSLGERGSAMSHSSSGRVEWLTYLGPRTVGAVRRDELAAVAGVEVEDVAGGILIRLDPSSATRRTKSYWERARAVEATIGRPPLVKVSRSGRAVAAPRTTPPQTPTALVPRPVVTSTGTGGRHFSGARYEGMRFAQMELREPGAVVEGFELVKCEFDNVAIGSLEGPPVTVRACTLTRCRSRVVTLWLVALEDCVIDGHIGGFSATASVLLRHVVLRGAIDAIDLRLPRQILSPERIVRAHDEHYRTVDWALDIREARFKRCDLGGVPRVPRPAGPRDPGPRDPGAGACGRLARSDGRTLLERGDRAPAREWRRVGGVRGVPAGRSLRGGVGRDRPPPRGGRRPTGLTERGGDEGGPLVHTPFGPQLGAPRPPRGGPNEAARGQGWPAAPSRGPGPRRGTLAGRRPRRPAPPARPAGARSHAARSCR